MCEFAHLLAKFCPLRLGGEGESVNPLTFEHLPDWRGYKPDLSHNSRAEWILGAEGGKAGKCFF